MADTLCNGIKKAISILFYFFPIFFPLSSSSLYQLMGFLFSIIFSPSSLGHARRELRLSFLPCIFFFKRVRFCGLLFNSCRAGTEKGREGLSAVRCLLSSVKYFIHTPENMYSVDEMAGGRGCSGVTSFDRLRFIL